MMIFRDDSFGKTRVKDSDWDAEVERMIRENRKDIEIFRQTGRGFWYISEMRYLLKALESQPRPKNEKGVFASRCKTG